MSRNGLCCNTDPMMVSDYLLVVLWGVVAILAVVFPPGNGRGSWCRHCADKPVPRPGGVCRVCGGRRMVADDAGIEELGF